VVVSFNDVLLHGCCMCPESLHPENVRVGCTCATPCTRDAPCCHVPRLGGCDRRGVWLQLSEEKNWGPLIHKGRLYFVTNTVPMEIVRADPTDGSCVVVFKESITNRNSLYTRYGMPIRGGSQFVPFNATHWMAIVHQRKDYPYGPVYTHRTMMLSFGEHDTEVPTHYSLSEPYR
jgi:hypothetical protein